MSSEAMTNLDVLFPAPTLPPSVLSPQRFPGASIESLAALQYVLKDNHKKWHIFVNDLKFHNHITHRALALYALGSNGAPIRTFYQQDAQTQRPVIEPPEAITSTNFFEHLQDARYYLAYVAFFSKEVDDKGATRVLEEYIFSETYRSQDSALNQPEMLNLFLSGLLHAFIHVGHGLEFGLKGMVVEGLALMAVHDPDGKNIFPPSFFDSVPQAAEEQVTRLLLSLTLDRKVVDDCVLTTNDTHVFDIIARILKDDHLRVECVQHSGKEYKRAVNEHGPAIRQYVAQWTINMTRPGEVERKIEELSWACTILYAIGGFDEAKGFAAEFFLMHLVTSSLFLPSVIAYLTPRSQALLLRGYLSTVLTWWVSRGRPALNIKSFMALTSAQPTSPTFQRHVGEITVEKEVPNTFLPIIQSAILHPNDHLPKIQRSFAHFSALYGRRPAGYFDSTELEGAELLDGSLFFRAARLTMDYMGWVREGQPAKMWHMGGFF
ncbi:hypothetical protein V8B97DRAFT_1965781 [Scleroderma yunnanense]